MFQNQDPPAVSPSFISRKIRSSALVCLSALSLLATPNAFAQNQAMADGEYTTDSIWNTGTAPAIGDGLDVFINSANGGRVVTVTGGSALANGTLRVAENGTNGQMATLNLVGGTLTAGWTATAANHEVGGGGTRMGVVNVDATSHLEYLARNVFVGVAGGNTGFINIAGGSVTSFGNFRLGNTGMGIGSINAGVLRVDQDIQMAQNAGSSGTLFVTGGQVRVGERGTDGMGGGNNDILVGANANGTGVINLAGGTIHSLDNNRPIQIGVNGAAGATGGGFLNIDSGLITSQGNLNVGQNFNEGAQTGSFGQINMTGGVINLADEVILENGMTINSGDNLVIGVNGTGLLNMTGGTIEIDSIFNGQPGMDDNTDRDLQVGVRAGSYGSAYFGTGSYVNGGELRVGQGSGQNNQNDANRPAPATGIVTIDGGSVVFHGGGNQNTGTGVAIFIGQEDDSSGTVNLVSGHLITSGDILLANAGTVNLHTNPANATQTRFATVFGASEGFFNQTGGTLTLGNATGGNDDMFVANRGTATANFMGGVTRIGRNIVAGNVRDLGFNDGLGGGFGDGTINIGGDANVHVGFDQAGGDIILAAATGATGVLNVQDNAILRSDQLLIGQAGGDNNVNDAGVPSRAIGVANFSGGVSSFNSNGNSIVIGNQDDSSGTMIMTGGHVITIGDLTMANEGAMELHTNVNVNPNQTRFAAVFGAAEGFLEMSGGTLDVGNGTGDNMFVGNRGTAVVNISNDAVLNVAEDLILGNLNDTIGTDTNGAGRGFGSIVIKDNARVTINRFFDIGGAGDGEATITGTTSPVVEVAGSVRLGINPGATGKLALEGGTLMIGGDLDIGGPSGTASTFTQTGGVLMVDSNVITQNVQVADPDGSGNISAGHLFTKGLLTTSTATDASLVIGNFQGDVVFSDEAAIQVVGGERQTFDPDDFDNQNPGNPGFEDEIVEIDGLSWTVSEGFRSVDIDTNPTFGAGGPNPGIEVANAAGNQNFVGGGAFDFSELAFDLIPTRTDAIQIGAFFFMFVNDPGGGNGGDDIQDTTGFLDDIALNGFDTKGAIRLTEEQFETMTSTDGSQPFDPTTNPSVYGYYALVAADSFFFTPNGGDIGVRWLINIPEPGSALLLALGSALFLARRRRR